MDLAVGGNFLSSYYNTCDISCLMYANKWLHSLHNFYPYCRLCLHLFIFDCCLNYNHCDRQPHWTDICTVAATYWHNVIRTCWRVSLLAFLNDEFWDWFVAVCRRLSICSRSLLNVTARWKAQRNDSRKLRRSYRRKPQWRYSIAADATSQFTVSTAELHLS